MMKSSPNYLKSLAKMPNADAYRYGNWDAMGGNFFKDFMEATHVRKAFAIPSHWQMYRSFDYGLDKFACFWWAIDTDGRAWCIRSYEAKDLNVQDAAREALKHTLPNENIALTYAPPDMWSRQKDTGRTMAEIFMLSGVPIYKADNNRVQGHMIMRQMLADIPLKDPDVIAVYRNSGGEVPKALPGLMFFDTVGGVIDDIKSIQADETNPNDCAKEPHEITHTVDGCRYFCISRTMVSETPTAEEEVDEFEEVTETYEAYMCGGNPTHAYMNY